VTLYDLETNIEINLFLMRSLHLMWRQLLYLWCLWISY